MYGLGNALLTGLKTYQGARQDQLEERAKQQQMAQQALQMALMKEQDNREAKKFEIDQADNLRKREVEDFTFAASVADQMPDGSDVPESLLPRMKNSPFVTAEPRPNPTGWGVLDGPDPRPAQSPSGFRTVQPLSTKRQLQLQQQEAQSKLQEERLKNAIEITKMRGDNSTTNALIAVIAKQNQGQPSDGLVNAVIANPAMYSGLSAKTRETLLPKLTAAGLDAGTLLRPTKEQANAKSFATRMQDAETILKDKENEITKMTVPGFYLEHSWMPSGWQSKSFRQFDQASRNLINAILRRESGAVISPNEFDNANVQYLPRPNDDTDTLAQKAKNRKAQLDGLLAEAGPFVENTPGPSRTYTIVPKQP